MIKNTFYLIFLLLLSSVISIGVVDFIDFNLYANTTSNDTSVSFVFILVITLLHSFSYKVNEKIKRKNHYLYKNPIK